MAVSIFTLDEFKRQFKRLAKKYKSLVSDLQELQSSLASNPSQGADLGGNVRKVRMQISSKSKGKSGGARVLTYLYYVDEDNSELTLMSIYDKSEIESVSDAYIKSLTDQL